MTVAPSPSRRLSTHQKAVLIQVLNAFPEQDVGVWATPEVADADDYAEDFVTIFRAIGWNVSRPDMAGVLNGNVAGLALLSNSEEGLTGCAEALRDALRIYNLEVATPSVPCSAIARGSFVFAVGAAAQSS
jgi:hypothetical protein